MEYSLVKNAAKRTTRWQVISYIILGLMIVALAIAVLALGITLGAERSSNGSSTPSPSNSNSMTINNDTTSDICLTKDCVELSSQISRSLDPSVDPCENFYQFACNRFVQENIIPAGEPLITGFSKLGDLNGERIRVILESSDGQGLDSLNKAIALYDSCLNIELMDSRSEEDFLEVLQNLGGWPLVGIASNTTWSINDESHLMEKLYGSIAFFSSTVQADPRNTSQNVYCVTQAGLTLPAPAAYAYNDTRIFMVNTMVEVFSAINSSIPMETYLEAAMEILELETQIASPVHFILFYFPVFESNEAPILAFDLPLLFQPYYEVLEVTTYRNLSEIMPEVDWINNLNFYGRKANFFVQPSDDVCLLIRPNLLQTLNRLIANTDTRILANYAKWHFMLAVLGELSARFREINDVITRQRTGSASNVPRDVFCFSAVQHVFRYPIARAFFDSYVSPRIMETVSEMAEEIRGAMIERINGIGWLDDVTKQRALNKVRLVASFQALPKEIFNDSFLDSLYSNYNVAPTSGYFINAINTISANKLFQLSFLGRINTRSNWYLEVGPPTQVNAFYYALLNHFYILEGILNAPFFKEYWPDYFKYGALGVVIGHEITHGFDTNGQRFDEYGNFANWWTESSQAEFDKRARCFAEQYSNYRVEAGQVDGNLTLSENIADNGGLAISYLAYKNLQRNAKPEKKLPALPYTPDQLFFIASAQPYCSVITQSIQFILLIADNHSPNSIRPIGSVSNSPEFAEVFNCPAGSPMNPTKKCRLW